MPQLARVEAAFRCDSCSATLLASLPPSHCNFQRVTDMPSVNFVLSFSCVSHTVYLYLSLLFQSPVHPPPPSPLAGHLWCLRTQMTSVRTSWRHCSTCVWNYVPQLALAVSSSCCCYGCCFSALPASLIPGKLVTMLAHSHVLLVRFHPPPPPLQDSRGA
jgi:hypothetical protein